jgi:hypothetical protein
VKLTEIIDNKVFYHATPANFKTFKPVPTFFSLNAKDAKNWHTNGHDNHGKQTTYKVKYTGERIASIGIAKKFAKKVWPDEDFLYSMFDVNVGEFEEKDVKQFINLMIHAGYQASYLEDYDPADFGGGSSTKTLVIFDPSKFAEIVGEESFGKIKTTTSAPVVTPEKLTLADLKVGQTVKFYDSGLNRREGTIIQLIPADMPRSQILNHDKFSIYALADIAERDGFQIEVPETKNHYLRLLKHIIRD